jgi:hypothetical protein
MEGRRIKGDVKGWEGKKARNGRKVFINVKI